MNILLVDDEKECLESLKLALEPLHYEISTQTDPLEAMNMIKKENYDLVITDMRMPKLTGLDLLYRIKDYNKKIRVIIMTAYGDMKTLLNSVNNRVYAFFLKPVDINEIINTLKEIEMEIIEAEELGLSDYELLKRQHEALKKSYLKLFNHMTSLNG